MCFAPQRRALFRHLNFKKWSEHGVFCTCSLPHVLPATTACTFSTSQLPKVARTWVVLYIFTSRCASRHNGAHCFHISTSKSRPNPTCFDTFYFEMCFAPQRRALFQHLNYQKWLGPDVLKELKLITKPFTGRTLRGPLIQMQNISLRSSGMCRKQNFEF